jgi:hypothetical protein
MALVMPSRAYTSRNEGGGFSFSIASAHGEFVYSAPEIARVRDRKSRLNLAWEVVNRPGRFKKAA